MEVEEERCVKIRGSGENPREEKPCFFGSHSLLIIQHAQMFAFYDSDRRKHFNLCRPTIGWTFGTINNN